MSGSRAQSCHFRPPVGGPNHVNGQKKTESSRLVSGKASSKFAGKVPGGLVGILERIREPEGFSGLGGIQGRFPERLIIGIFMLLICLNLLNLLINTLELLLIELFATN